MSKPYIHAQNSATKFGGVPEDYIDIHNLMDSSKKLIADVRHRALFHHAAGPFIMEEIFGVTRENSDGKTYSVRDIAEQHILEDLGFIPSFEEYVKTMPIAGWMAGEHKDVTNDNLQEFIEEQKIIETTVFQPGRRRSPKETYFD